MQSENFDNKVRQAAEQHHANYDERAWSKMEKLLDRHLPQKDDRRRIIFLLLFFLLVGGGIWLLISKPWKPNYQSLSVTNTGAKHGTEPSANSTKESAGRSTDEISPAIKSSANENKAPGNTEAEENNNQQKDKNLTGINGTIANPLKEDKLLYSKDNRTDQLETDITNPGTTKQNKITSINNTDAVVSSPVTNDKLAKNENTKDGNDQPALKNIGANKTIETKKEDVSDQPNKTDEKTTAKKGTNKKGNSFFFSFSAGPDISSVNVSKPGKMKLLAGLGIGYTFRNRLTIRTGFYTASKVYTAGKDEYKPEGGIINRPYLDKIDADCKVYEIPLNLSYNFSKSAKNSLFATAGLSSFIMKKETYVYLYKYTGPPPSTYTYTKTVNNENKHYFSVLTLSGGYQRKINNVLSIAAEPYVKVPLAGVGFGNVKLNSAGILFSVNIKPFQSAAKK